MTGPIDVVEDGLTGALDWDLAAASVRALRARPQDCRARAVLADWMTCTREFKGHLVPAGI